ncbi:MAG TPA: helix-turn-helix domain-containing protein [Flavisolibacter sp.]|nr:helix-turn-helix domain-containing protein [Flavisolibacter sp.]
MAKHDPSANDLRILEYLQQGNTLSHIEAINLFNTNQLRDSIYHLRKAGHVIESNRHDYVNNKGQKKHYIIYSIKQKAA